jgi:hypothetical protein
VGKLCFMFKKVDYATGVIKAWWLCQDSEHEPRTRFLILTNGIFTDVFIVKEDSGHQSDFYSFLIDIRAKFVPRKTEGIKEMV